MDVSKLDAAITKLGMASARMDILTRKDAEFNEADHPRDESGKFGSGGAYDSKVTLPVDHVGYKEALKKEQKTFDKAYTPDEFPLEKVPTDKIKATQNEVNAATIRKYRAEYKSKGGFNNAKQPHPSAYKHKGSYYIADGHHRVEAASQEGASHVQMHVMDLDI